MTKTSVNCLLLVLTISLISIAFLLVTKREARGSDYLKEVPTSAVIGNSSTKKFEKAWLTMLLAMTVTVLLGCDSESAQEPSSANDMGTSQTSSQKQNSVHRTSQIFLPPQPWPASEAQTTQRPSSLIRTTAWLPRVAGHPDYVPTQTASDHLAPNQAHSRLPGRRPRQQRFDVPPPPPPLFWAFLQRRFVRRYILLEYALAGTASTSGELPQNLVRIYHVDNELNAVHIIDLMLP